MSDHLQGHGEPCYYCGKPCSSLHGNPGLWPIALCHRDDPGRVKWHHTMCVCERLVENQRPLNNEGLDNAICDFEADIMLLRVNFPKGPLFLTVKDPELVLRCLKAFKLMGDMEREIKVAADRFEHMAADLNEGKAKIEKMMEDLKLKMETYTKTQNDDASTT